MLTNFKHFFNPCVGLKKKERKICWAFEGAGFLKQRPKQRLNNILAECYSS